MAAATVFDEGSQSWVTLSTSALVDLVLDVMRDVEPFEPSGASETSGSLYEYTNPFEFADDDDQSQDQYPHEPCRNCLSPFHWTDDCEADCGHCGQRWHTVDACESVPRNHCKCSPFPQRHLAKRCLVVCTAECPKTDRDQPGSEYHRNAMMCKARCCMCGLLGHAGRDCHLKRCRCGVAHLTIDHPSERRRCVVEECPRWYCTKHCQHSKCKAELAKLGEEKCSSCGKGQMHKF
ncbi:major facilitator superfamily transporter [Colletotrichum truncatum]|uniref:Major facilitator superfamily transporter n=1 Tax=Colletotrichum truncatum TaxID=5467 RepID=A0ACC3YFL8_COLTU|nr:major facilitator superfamily transporter [Colletotrichum truncatum]KAF6788383.1 major facilitator superfamily transporter [Colletotrichum truncatum]